MGCHPTLTLVPLGLYQTVAGVVAVVEVMEVVMVIIYCKFFFFFFMIFIPLTNQSWLMNLRVIFQFRKHGSRDEEPDLLSYISTCWGRPKRINRIQVSFRSLFSCKIAVWVLPLLVNGVISSRISQNYKALFHSPHLIILFTRYLWWRKAILVTIAAALVTLYQ